MGDSGHGGLHLLVKVVTQLAQFYSWSHPFVSTGFIMVGSHCVSFGISTTKADSEKS